MVTVWTPSPSRFIVAPNWPSSLVTASTKAASSATGSIRTALLSTPFGPTTPYTANGRFVSRPVPASPFGPARAWITPSISLAWSAWPANSARYFASAIRPSNDLSRTTTVGSTDLGVSARAGITAASTAKVTAQLRIRIECLSSRDDKVRARRRARRRTRPLPRRRTIPGGSPQSVGQSPRLLDPQSLAPFAATGRAGSDRHDRYGPHAAGRIGPRVAHSPYLVRRPGRSLG